MKKDQKILIGAVVGLVVIIAIVLFSIFGKGNTSKTTPSGDEMMEIVPTISPEELGFELSAGKGGKTVILELSETKGLETVEYTLSYLDAEGIERGAFGELELDKTPVLKEVTLGTCSDVCHYDEGVTSVKVVLKVTKDDGSVYQLEQTLDL